MIDKPCPHSYNVQTPGGIYIQNQRHMLPLPTEDVTPIENIIPESLPLNACHTKSERISKPPEKQLVREM